jgi:hypothetical protein
MVKNSSPPRAFWDAVAENNLKKTKKVFSKLEAAVSQGTVLKDKTTVLFGSTL